MSFKVRRARSYSLTKLGWKNDPSWYCENPCQHHPVTNKYPRHGVPSHLENIEHFIAEVSQGLGSIVFPRRPHPYTSVHVLLISWEDNDLNTAGDIKQLQSLFKEQYNFTTEHFKIPASKKCGVNLELKLVKTKLERASESDSLLIVYYGGHGEVNKSNRHSIWKAWQFQPIGGPALSPSLDWSVLQGRVMDAEGDVLFILDCCYAASMVHGTQTGARELLLASGKTDKASDKNTFTRALISELRELRGRPCTAKMLHHLMLEHQSQHSLITSPLYDCLSESSSAIVLAPLDNGAAAAPLPDASLTVGSLVNPQCRVLISISLVNMETKPIAAVWLEWFKKYAPPEIAGIDIGLLVRPEAAYEANSTMLLVSLPTALWNALPHDPAISFVSEVRSENLLRAAKYSSRSTQTITAVEDEQANEGLEEDTLKARVEKDTLKGDIRSEETGLRILALDDGGHNGISQLIILRALMHCVQVQDGLNYIPKPCDYFELISGAGIGGLMAILLGRLCLSVDDAIKEYVFVMNETFSKQNAARNEVRFDMKALEVAIKSVVKKYSNHIGDAEVAVAPSGRDSGTRMCHVFVTTRSGRARDPHAVEWYNPFSTKEDDLGNTAWQAARATLEASTIFQAKASDWANNPTFLLPSQAKQIYGSAQPVSIIISVGAGGNPKNSLMENDGNAVGPDDIDAEMQQLEAMLNEMKAGDNTDTVSWIKKCFPGVYFRLGVDRALPSIDLEESKRIQSIVTSTDEYLEDVVGSIEQAAKLLTLREIPSYTVADIDAAIYPQQHVAKTTLTPAENPNQAETLNTKNPSTPTEKETEPTDNTLLLAELRDSLLFPEMLSREVTIVARCKQALEDTFSWALGGDEADDSDISIVRMKNGFKEWIDGDRPLLWVSGSPASGKSTLMRQVYRGLRSDNFREWAPRAQVTFAGTFLTCEGARIQQSLEGLLRSLISEALLDEDLIQPVLGQFLHKAQERGTGQFTRISWTYVELQTAFETLLAQASDTQRFCFFIDALNEAELTSAEHDELVHIVQKISQTQWVKICVSSRPWTAFKSAFSGFPKLYLDQVNGRDIESFVMRYIPETAQLEPSNNYNGLVKEIVAKANGCFLFAKIMAGIIANMATNINIADMEEVLRQMPSGLEELYMKMLELTVPAERKGLRRIFEVMLHARRPLTTLMRAMATGFTPEQVLRMNVQWVDNDQLQNLLDAALGALQGPFTALLEVQETTHYGKEEKKGEAEGLDLSSPAVRFVHLTAKEFVQQPYVQLWLKSEDPDAHFDPATALLSACVLHLKRIGMSSSADDFWTYVQDANFYAAKADPQAGNATDYLLRDVNELVSKINSLFLRSVLTTSPDDTTHGDFLYKPKWG